MDEVRQLKHELEQARQRIAELQDLEAEHQLREEALKAAEWEKEMILDSQLEHVVYQDLHNKVLWVNQAAFESVGATREELIGRYCYEIWAGRDEPCEDCPVIQAFETGQVQEVEKTTPDGRSWYIRGFPVRDVNGNIVSGIEITQEITERVRSESERDATLEALRESEQRYRLALSATNDGFWDWNVQTGEVFFSDRYYTMLGYEPGEFPASFESWEKLVHPDDVDRARHAIELYLNGKADTYAPEFRLKTKSGRWKWILARGEVVTRAEDGSPLQFIGTHTDIDKRVRVEAEREQAQQDLIEAQQQAIQELSTPVIPIMDRILVMPLVGSVDSARAKHIMRTLLEGIRVHRATVVILDITGVPIIDSGVATHLDKTIQAARLKGARTIITGISDAVAEAVVDLGIDWNELVTLSTLQTGLIFALNELGLRLSKTQHATRISKGDF